MPNAGECAELHFFRHPEPAVIGEITDLGCLAREFIAGAVMDVRPSCCSHVFEDFFSIRQVHECIARGFVGEVAVAEFQEAWVLFTLRPERGLLCPGFQILGVFPVVGGEDKMCAGPAELLNSRHRRPAILASGDLHQPVKHKKCTIKGDFSQVWVVRSIAQLGRVSLKKGDASNTLFLLQVFRLVDEFGGKIESGDVPVALMPETDGDATGTAARFEEIRRFVGQVALDQRQLGFPEADEMRGAGVV